MNKKPPFGAQNFWLWPGRCTDVFPVDKLDKLNWWRRACRRDNRVGIAQRNPLPREGKIRDRWWLIITFFLEAKHVEVCPSTWLLSKVFSSAFKFVLASPTVIHNSVHKVKFDKRRRKHRFQALGFPTQNKQFQYICFDATPTCHGTHQTHPPPIKQCGKEVVIVPRMPSVFRSHF